MHELLPWYANDTLGPEERVAFEEHLASCVECRNELELVERMRRKLREAGREAFTDHPSPEVLLAAVRREQADVELDDETVRRVRRHLALCLTCADEAEWLTGEAVAAGAEEGEDEESDAPPEGRRSIAAPRRRGPVLPWVGLAAAVLVIAVLAPLALRSPTPTPGPVTVGVVRSVRSILPAEAIEVGSDSSRVILRFEADLAPEDYPARLVIERGRAGGEPIVTVEIDHASDMDDGLVDVGCPRELCSDGEYVARLTRAGDGPVVEYRFRLEARP